MGICSRSTLPPRRRGVAATRKGLFIALAMVENWQDGTAQLDKRGVM